MEESGKHSVPHEDLSPRGRQVVQSYIATTAMYDFNVYEKRVMYNLDAANVSHFWLRKNMNTVAINITYFKSIQKVPFAFI